MNFRARARQWSRAAWALAVLFASLPAAGRLFMGVWTFPSARDAAFLCLALGTYLHFVGRKHLRAEKDNASRLGEALALASEGSSDKAVARLTVLIQRDPRFWQAYQYRGQLHLRQPETWEAAAQDFTRAIALAPKEAHLYTLRAQAHNLLGDDQSAREDAEAAAALGMRSG